MDLIGTLVDAWRRHGWSTPRIRRVLVVESRAELPGAISRRSLAVIGADRPKWLVFWCPCGHGHRIDLDAHARHRPSWSIVVDGRGRPTVTPSIDVRGERRCHFWVRQGRVVWCPSSPGQIG